MVFIPEVKDPITHWIGGWVGLRVVGLDAVAKRKDLIISHAGN
jgi:hypothetical protein